MGCVVNSVSSEADIANGHAFRARRISSGRPGYDIIREPQTRRRGSSLTFLSCFALEVPPFAFSVSIWTGLRLCPQA